MQNYKIINLKKKDSPHENPKNSNQSQIYKAGVKPRLDRRFAHK